MDTGKKVFLCLNLSLILTPDLMALISKILTDPSSHEPHMEA